MNDRSLWLILRLALAGLILAHGWHRVLHGGVGPFGNFLDARGFVIGDVLAWTITVMEMFAPALLIVGRHVFPVTLVFAFAYGMGIWLVHYPAGWFVVGPGRNGMEYSVLLILALLCVGLHYRGQR